MVLIEINGVKLWVNPVVVNEELRELMTGNQGKHDEPSEPQREQIVVDPNVIILSLAEQRTMLLNFKFALDQALRIEAEATPPVPPRIAEMVMSLFCSAEMREAVLGDLDEQFHDLSSRHGLRFANAWYWWQAVRSVGFFAFTWVRRLLELEALLRRIL